MSIGDKLRLASVCVWGVLLLQAFSMWLVLHIKTTFDKDSSIPSMINGIKVSLMLYLWIIIAAAILGINIATFVGSL